jgi:hypothetical protein
MPRVRDCGADLQEPTPTGRVAAVVAVTAAALLEFSELLAANA